MFLITNRVKGSTILFPLNQVLQIKISFIFLIWVYEWEDPINIGNVL